MTSEPRYAIHKEVKYGFLERFDVGRIRDRASEDWLHQTLARVNDCVVRLGVVQGEFHWHRHDGEDEFFYVVSGKLLIDLEDETIELAANQGFTIPRGARHRTRAPERTTMLMVSGAGIEPTGDEQAPGGEDDE